MGHRRRVRTHARSFSGDRDQPGIVSARPRRRGTGGARVLAHHPRASRGCMRRGRGRRRSCTRPRRRGDRGDPSRGARPPRGVLPRAGPHPRAAGRLQPSLRAVQPGAVHRADRRSPRGDRRRSRGIGDPELHVRQPVALRLLVLRRAAVRVDPARAGGAAVRGRHAVGEPGARVQRALDRHAVDGHRAHRRAQREQGLRAVDATAP